MEAPLPEGIKVQAQSSTTGCEGYVGWAKTTYHVQNDSEDVTYTTQQVPLRFKVSAVGPGLRGLHPRRAQRSRRLGRSRHHRRLHC